MITLGRTLKRRAVDVLAYFDRPGTSNGPTEAINGRLDTSAAQPSASATSPATSRDRFWRPAGSGPDYTLDHEEPAMAWPGFTVMGDQAEQRPGSWEKASA